jgi:hypothetical protein
LANWYHVYTTQFDDQSQGAISTYLRSRWTRVQSFLHLQSRNNSPENDLPYGGPNTAVLHVSSKLREEESQGDIFWIPYHMRHPTEKATYAIRSMLFRPYTSLNLSFYHPSIKALPGSFGRRTVGWLAHIPSAWLVISQPAPSSSSNAEAMELLLAKTKCLHWHRRSLGEGLVSREGNHSCGPKAGRVIQ